MVCSARDVYNPTVERCSAARKQGRLEKLEEEKVSEVVGTDLPLEAIDGLAQRARHDAYTGR